MQFFVCIGILACVCFCASVSRFPLAGPHSQKPALVKILARQNYAQAGQKQGFYNPSVGPAETRKTNENLTISPVLGALGQAPEHPRRGRTSEEDGPLQSSIYAIARPSRAPAETKRNHEILQFAWFWTLLGRRHNSREGTESFRKSKNLSYRKIR